MPCEARRRRAKQGGMWLGFGDVRYVYLLESVSHPGKRYIGKTSDLQARLSEHNAGKSPHTSKHTPWQLVVAIGFENEAKADAFERYLKHGSGHAFAKRHFW
jgi:putative endonuclease